MDLLLPFEGQAELLELNQEPGSIYCLSQADFVQYKGDTPREPGLEKSNYLVALQAGYV
jgi:hypothetical protein